MLRFSEPLNAQASRIEVVDQSGREVTVGPTMPVEGDPKAMRRKLDLLSPGQYTVRWTTVSTRDGHSRRGSYTFAIATASLANERIENSPVASEGWLGLLGRFAALLGLGLWSGSALLGRVATYAGVPEARRFLLGRLGPVLAFAGTTLSVVSSAVIAAGSVGGRPVIRPLYQTLLIPGALVVSVLLGNQSASHWEDFIRARRELRGWGLPMTIAALRTRPLPRER